MTVIQKKRILRDLSRYSGKWVAFIDNDIAVVVVVVAAAAAAAAETLKDLMEKVKKMNLKEKVSVFLVPRKDEGPYASIIL